MWQQTAQQLKDKVFRKYFVLSINSYFVTLLSIFFGSWFCIQGAMCAPQGDVHDPQVAVSAPTTPCTPQHLLRNGQKSNMTVMWQPPWIK